jgi:hypothetical protein
MKRLTTRGNRLLFDGKPVRLRGVATGDPVNGRAGRDARADYRTIAREWKANVVRFGIHPSVWKADRRAALAGLRRDADAALAEGMFVIIDWHTIGWPDGRYEIPSWPGGVKDYYDSSVALATDYWAAVSSRFGREGRVAFELWNEPTDLDHPDRDPKKPSDWPRLRPVLQKLVNVVRKRSDNLILGTGGSWAYDLRGVRERPLTGGNIAYAWHVYAGHDGNDPKKWAFYLDELQKTYPVVVTEWGFDRNATGEHFQGTPETFGNRFAREFLDGRGLHDTAWCWHPVWGPKMLKEDWRTPTEYGAFVRQRLAK